MGGDDDGHSTYFRLDKFYTLIRFMLRETFELLKQRDWNIATIHKLNEVLLESPFRSISKEGHGEGVLKLTWQNLLVDRCRHCQPSCGHFFG